MPIIIILFSLTDMPENRLEDEEFVNKFTRFLYGSVGSKHRLLLGFETDLECGEPAPKMTVSLSKTHNTVMLFALIHFNCRCQWFSLHTIWCLGQVSKFQPWTELSKYWKMLISPTECSQCVLVMLLGKRMRYNFCYIIIVVVQYFVRNAYY